jgi:uncharacterized protein (TIGR01777 family)
MRVVVTGATGQIGSALTRRLSGLGHQVVVFTRRPKEAAGLLPEAAGFVAFDPALPQTWEGALEAADAVVVLGGAPFFRKWSSWEEFERVATGGRVAANRAIVAAIGRAAHKPAVLVTGSAVGFYGFEDSDVPVTEATPQGTDRWAAGTASYEQAGFAAEDYGVRCVAVRTGIVLGADEGMAAQMRAQFARGFGAVLLPGTQWLPWIHIQDEVELYRLAIEDDRVRGGLNASAPHPVRYREYAATMGRVLRKRVWLRLPGAVMRFALGDVADSVLHNRRMLPQKALDLGYTFHYPELEPALRDLLL